jgi:hypothetical protein
MMPAPLLSAPLLSAPLLSALPMPRQPCPARSFFPCGFAAFLLLAGSACPERNATPPAPLPPCSQVGQRCEFSPGKLGACVLRDDCRGNDCFVCQSQH